jgi:cardiolipin synthase A/B
LNGNRIPNVPGSLWKRNCDKRYRIHGVLQTKGKEADEQTLPGVSLAGSGPAVGSSPSGSKPTESRRWLKRRVPREQLYRLAPLPKRIRLGNASAWDRVRAVIGAWWAWFLIAFSFEALGTQLSRLAGLLAGGVSFALYHTAPGSHPAVYALDASFNTDSAEFQTTMAGVTGAPVLEGNRVEILNNGDAFYPVMLDAIESARLSITMEQYIFWKGEVGERFAEALAERACQGVQVKLLLDAIGSATLGSEIYETLEKGGCQLAWFRPIHLYTLHRANHRNHRKSLIVDGCVAFTGGAGLGDHWLGSASNPSEWRDIQIRVEGPAVEALQAGFAQNWLATTGEIINGHQFFPEPRASGNIPIQTILSSPSLGAGAAGTMYLIALQCAQRYLYIANPYFIPDSRVIAMLSAACQRGVNIKLMLAGQHNDTWWARQNSVRLYGELLRAGVEIYEFMPTMLHQKTMVVDGVWATVGTTNFDNRSFALNEETNICFHDTALVEQLRAIFENDLKLCQPMDMKAWKKRGRCQKSKEIVASLIQNQI